MNTQPRYATGQTWPFRKSQRERLQALGEQLSMRKLAVMLKTDPGYLLEVCTGECAPDLRLRARALTLLESRALIGHPRGDYSDQWGPGKEGFEEIEGWDEKAARAAGVFK